MATTGWDVSGVEIRSDDGNDIIIRFYCAESEDAEYRNAKEIGKTVFITQAEAEKALEVINDDK